MSLVKTRTDFALPLHRLKAYPRLQLDISFTDLTATLMGVQIPHRNHIGSIQSFWQVDKEILVTFSVRTSLDLLLQSLNLPLGSEVLISAVNIRDMVEILQRHGLIPVPVDISLETLAPSLELLEQVVSEKSKILLIAHLFGVIVPLQPYAEFCKKHNLLLIEDCAQAFVGDKYYGHPQADVSLFSFGPIKSCTALGGAVVLVRERSLAEKMRTQEQQYPKKSEFWFRVRVLKYLGLKLLSIKWIYRQLLNILQCLHLDTESTIKATTRGFPKGDLLSKIRYRPPNRLLWLLAHRLNRCEEFARREATARKFLGMLTPNIAVPGSQAQFNSFWLFPILVPPSLESLPLQLRQNGFDTARGNTSLFLIEPTSTEAQHPLPENAKYLVEHLLCLPVSKFLSEKELLRLAQYCLPITYS